MLPIPEGSEGVSGPAAVLILAVVQGLAEFLPISSSGHLVLGRAVLGLREAGLALDVALHVGTFFAVVWAYRRDVRELVGDVLVGRFATALWLVVATIPAAVVGLTFKDSIEAAAQTTVAAGAGLCLTAALLLAGEWARGRQPDGDEPRPAGVPALGLAVAIGLAQCLALWPGVSRSGTTISAGLLLGLRGAQAARLSFLMSLPAVAGAAIVEIPDAVEVGFGGVAPAWVAGAVVLSAVVGVLALRTLLLVLHRGAFRWFAGYCGLLGILTLVFL